MERRERKDVTRSERSQENVGVHHREVYIEIIRLTGRLNLLIGTIKVAGRIESKAKPIKNVSCGT